MEMTNEVGTASAHVDAPQGKNEERMAQNEGRWWNWRVMVNLIIVGLAVGLFGYDNAFASPLVSLPLFVEKYQGHLVAGQLVFSAHNLQLMICVPLVGAAVGAFLAAPSQNRFGRKGAFLSSYCLLCIPGSMLQLFAPNLAAMVIGRFWNYVGVSVLTNCSPIYISELVPAHVRARAVGMTVAGAGATSVIATVVVWATSKYSTHWQYSAPLAVQAAMPIVFAILALFLTESPTWLMSHGRCDDARKNLILLRAGNILQAESELRDIDLALSSESEGGKTLRFWEILDRKNIERTLVASAFISLGQVGGQILVGTYSTVILVQSGVADPFKITIIIFLLQFVGTIVGPTLLDKVGRRPVALVGFLLIFIMDIIAGVLACVGLTTQPQRTALAALCIILSFANAVSFQSIAYVLPTEIPTLRLREPTMSWTIFWSYTTAILTTLIVPQITAVDGANLGPKAFLIFGGCMVVTTTVAFFFLPETANRTLVEIDQLYESGLSKRHWKASRLVGLRNIGRWDAGMLVGYLQWLFIIAHLSIYWVGSLSKGSGIR